MRKWILGTAGFMLAAVGVMVVLGTAVPNEHRYLYPNGTCAIVSDLSGTKRDCGPETRYTSSTIAWGTDLRTLP